MDLSIIIVNYNVKEFLQNLLSSIEKASQNINCEVIVVDNASDDGSVELLKEKYPDVKKIFNPVNLGFSKANNLGMKLSTGKYILLLNPDTIISEDTFETMINFFRANSEVGLAGCKILNPDGTLQLACRRSFPGPWTSFCKVTGLSTLFPKSKLFARYNLTYLDENQSYEVDAISGSFMMIRKDVYEKIGGLDETFFMYGEDLDWCYRVQKAGYKVYYVHSTRIIHYKGESTKRSSLDETKVFYNAMHLFVKKHFASSLIVEFILRSAIFIRTLFAFIGRKKLILISVILDFIFFNLSLFIAEKIYSSVKTSWSGFHEEAFLIIYSIPAIAQIITSSLLGAYKKDNISVLKGLIAVIPGFFVVSSLTYFFKEFAYSRIVIIINYLVLLIAFSGWRIFVKLFFKLGISSSENSIVRTLIVGVSDSALEIARKLKSKYTSYHNVEGLISTSRKDIGRKLEEVEVIGSIENILKIIKQKKISEVIFSSKDIAYNSIMKIVADCQKENVEFKLAGNNLEFLVGKSEVNILDDIPLIEITYNITQPLNKFIKRLFDIIISIFVMIFISPFVFLFTKESKNYFLQMIKNCPSVLMGKLSFVGPKEENNIYNLYLGKKGITGLWFLEKEENTQRLNIFYAKNQNIWLDLEIIGKTISKILFTKE